MKTDYSITTYGDVILPYAVYTKAVEKLYPNTITVRSFVNGSKMKHGLPVDDDLKIYFCFNLVKHTSMGNFFTGDLVEATHIRIKKNIAQNFKFHVKGKEAELAKVFEFAENFIKLLGLKVENHQIVERKEKENAT